MAQGMGMDGRAVLVRARQTACPAAVVPRPTLDPTRAESTPGAASAGEELDFWVDSVQQEQIRHATAIVSLEKGQHELANGQREVIKPLVHTNDELHLNERLDNVLTDSEPVADARGAEMTTSALSDQEDEQQRKPTLRSWRSRSRSLPQSQRR